MNKDLEKWLEPVSEHAGKCIRVTVWVIHMLGDGTYHAFKLNSVQSLIGAGRQIKSIFMLLLDACMDLDMD